MIEVEGKRAKKQVKMQSPTQRASREGVLKNGGKTALLPLEWKYKDRGRGQKGKKTGENAKSYAKSK
jgi:hypothetical protein